MPGSTRSAGPGSARPCATASSSRSSRRSSRPSSGRSIALALSRYQFRGRAATNVLIFLPMATPEIVLGASLLTMFVASAELPFMPEGVLYPLSIRTIIIAHIMFSISFVVVTVKARLAGFPAPSRGSGDGPRRERVDDVLEGHVPADPAGHHGGARCWRSACRSTTTSSRLHGRPDRRRSRCSSTARSCAASRSRSTSSGRSSS